MRLSRPTTRSAPRSRSPHAGYGPVKAERLSQAQSIPLRFLEHIVLDLKHAGIVASQRGAEGGYWLARGSAEVTLAAIIRGVEGPARLPTSQAERPTGTSRVAGWWQQI